MTLTGGDRARVHRVHSDAVRLAKLLSPDASKSLVCGLGGGVYRLAGNTKTSAGGRDENNTTALGQMRLNRLGQEDGALYVGVEVAIVKLLRSIYQVCFVALGSTIIVVRSCQAQIVKAQGDILMDEDLNLAGGANLKGCFDQLGAF